jgi:FlaA1/EpsC-like NDP-sugar epimerase
MIRLFRHYFSRTFLTLLVAETLHLFWSIYLGRALRMMLGYQETMPHFDEVVPNALVFVVVMVAIMTAMGLYERNFWSGRSDMLLRVGVSFLVGLFVMTLVYYLFPDISLGRGEFSLALGVAFVGVLVLRFMFFEVSNREALKHRVLVLGAGQNASRIKELQQGGNASFVVAGYVQLRENEQCQVLAEDLLKMDHLLDLADRLEVDELVVAPDDRRGGFLLSRFWNARFMASRSVASWISTSERQVRFNWMHYVRVT